MTRHRIEDCIVSDSGTLRDALRALDKGAVEIALVVDGDKRLVGTLTDGDVRRALLGTATLDTPLARYAQRNYIWVEPTANHAELLDLMQARGIDEIPVVDKSGRLVGLHLLRDFLGMKERPNWAVVMAGGRGTRLAPLTDSVPKPMIRVAGRPILERIVLHLVGHGFSRIFLSTNYLGHVVEKHFGDGSKFGARIDYLREETPLGTGGALALLPGAPSHPVLVMNGDLVTQANVSGLVDFHDRGKQLATIGIRRYHHTVPFGCIELARGPESAPASGADDYADSRIVEFEEKPTLTRFVNAGIYVLSPEVVARVPRAQEFPLTGLIEECLRKGEAVHGFEIEEDWIDVGHRDHLRQARGGE